MICWWILQYWSIMFSDGNVSRSATLVGSLPVNRQIILAIFYEVKAVYVEHSATFLSF